MKVTSTLSWCLQSRCCRGHRLVIGVQSDLVILSVVMVAWISCCRVPMWTACSRFFVVHLDEDGLNMLLWWISGR
jgi:hypothetical protein